MRTNTLIILCISIVFMLQSCGISDQEKPMDQETWKLGWRLIESTWDGDFTKADLQFDSLLASNKVFDDRFMIMGLKNKAELNKQNEILKILDTLPSSLLAKICYEEYAADMKPCLNVPKEKIENKALQLELISLFVADQAIRRNIMHDLIEKYQIDTTNIKTEYDRTNHNEINIDEINRNRLKEIFDENGFPTRKQIGKDAMEGIFLIIQHADGDKEWQKNQLPFLEEGVKNGDFPKSNYAFLYDRIKVNHQEPQRYGSQFETVNKKANIAILRETEDMPNLDQRRREMGLMPIEQYKSLILRQ